MTDWLTLCLHFDFAGPNKLLLVTFELSFSFNEFNLESNKSIYYCIFPVSLKMTNYSLSLEDDDELDEVSTFSSLFYRNYKGLANVCKSESGCSSRVFN